MVREQRWCVDKLMDSLWTTRWITFVPQVATQADHELINNGFIKFSTIKFISYFLKELS